MKSIQTHSPYTARTLLGRRSFPKNLFGHAGFVAGYTSVLGQSPTAATRPTYPSPEKDESSVFTRFPPKIRITRLETLLIKPRWLFLKIHTDEGLIGLGEPIVEGRAKTCAEAVREVEP